MCVCGILLLKPCPRLFSVLLQNDMYDRLDLTINPYIEKKLDFVMECADDLSQEQSKYNYYLRNAARLESQKQAFLAKRVRGASRPPQHCPGRVGEVADVISCVACSTRRTSCCGWRVRSRCRTTT
jgi:hypothetical protein